MPPTAPIIDRLQPVARDSGFRMDGFFVWCGSAVRVGDTYHLFASRWPEGTGDPDDLIGILAAYRHYSEIVRATATRATGPYQFQEVVLTGRGAHHWDAMGCHNPYIVRGGKQFVLFYSATFGNDRERGIGYAKAHSITGPWRRCESPIRVGQDCVNPAAWIEPDGETWLAYRHKSMKLGVARAERFDGDYEVVNPWIMPDTSLEDPFLMRADGRLHIIVEDNRGQITGHERWGAHLTSDDGINWRRHDPPIAYTHTVEWTDGTSTTFDRRERPFLLIENGRPTHLLTGVLLDGRAWNLVQPITP